MAKVTSWSIIVTLLGFVVSYITFVKNIIPTILVTFLYGEDSSKTLPAIFGTGRFTGQLFWAAMYCGLVLFPVSLSRKLSTLRYFSLFGFFCSIYLALVITFVFFFDDSMVAKGQRLSPSQAFKSIFLFKWKFEPIIRAVPFCHLCLHVPS
jgi:amino acid permease